MQNEPLWDSQDAGVTLTSEDQEGGWTRGVTQHPCIFDLSRELLPLPSTAA
jgi:hypothetical protein